MSYLKNIKKESKRKLFNKNIKQKMKKKLFNLSIDLDVNYIKGNKLFESKNKVSISQNIKNKIERQPKLFPNNNKIDQRK